MARTKRLRQCSRDCFWGGPAIPTPSRFWDQLIALIEDRKVVPVVGQDLLTVPESTGFKQLYPLLANRVATYLEVNAQDLPAGGELNEVAYRWSKENPNEQTQIYSALYRQAAEAEALPLPEPLLQLASLPFPVFISTTFDSTLARAINQKRYGGRPKTQVIEYSLTDLKDIPSDAFTAGTPIVYQLMGKLSATPAFAVTQEDYIEFFHSLQSESHRPRQLFYELSNRNLLMLGTRLSGWLTSFLMRMSKQQRLSLNDKTDYVADDTVSHDENLVLFLQRFSKGTKIFPEADPVAFVAELFRRWAEVHPETTNETFTPTAPAQDAHEVPPGAVFLSYASENRDAVEKLKAALDQAGVDVFFDREQLQSGNNWNVKLRRNISECSLFIPLISKETLTDDDRYFRIEWRLALERMQSVSFDPEHAFVLPVVIDDTVVTCHGLPLEFAALQATPLPGGVATSEFVERVRRLYRKRQLAKTTGAA